MAGGKVSPRQKMINMMYLVLTALLAMNVSKEILKAFHQMDEGFEKSVYSTEGKIKGTMGIFTTLMNEKGQKTKPYMDIASEVNSIADGFVTFIGKHKADVLEASGGAEEEVKKDEGFTKAMPKAPDDLEKHYHYFVKEGHGKKIQQEINAVRTKLLALVSAKVHSDTTNGIKLNNPNIATQLGSSTGLKAQDGKGKGKDWVTTYLGEKQPLGSILPYLTKIQSDARSLQSDILTELAGSIDASAKITPDKLDAAVVSETTFVRVGEQFQSKIYLAAYDSKSQPDIFVGGQKIKVENGQGIYTSTSSTVGEHTYTGKIVIQTDEGPEEIPFTQTWTSFKPSASVGLDKMNLMYVGIDNPLTVSVSGYSMKDVSASASGATLSKKGSGKYIAKVARGVREVVVRVSVKGKSMGSQTFRVRNLPALQVQLGGIPATKNAITRGELRGSVGSGLIIGLGASFPYDGIRYRMISCKVMAISRRMGPRIISCNGTLGPARSALSQLTTGDMVIFSNIRASGPGGTRGTPNLSFTIR